MENELKQNGFLFSQNIFRKLYTIKGEPVVVVVKKVESPLNAYTKRQFIKYEMTIASKKMFGNFSECKVNCIEEVNAQIQKFDPHKKGFVNFYLKLGLVFAFAFLVILIMALLKTK